MNIKRNISILFVIFFIQLGLFAQAPLDEEIIVDGEVTPETTETKIEKKVDFDLSVGSSYSFLGKFGSYSNFYVSPSWNYKLNPRFLVRAGALINYTPYTSVPSGLFYNENTQFSAPPVGVMLYTQGTYFLSPRLTVTGTAYKEVTSSYKPFINPYYNNYKMQGVSIGFDYKLFENVHIGAQFNYNNTPPGYFNNSLNNSVIDNYYW